MRHRVSASINDSLASAILIAAVCSIVGIIFSTCIWPEMITTAYAAEEQSAEYTIRKVDVGVTPGLVSSSHARERLDNPNPFNDSVVIDNDILKYTDEVNPPILLESAEYIYEKTGCQLYLIGIDITDYDITSYADAYLVVKEYVESIITDSYAIVVPITSQYITEVDDDGNAAAVQVCYEVFYGDTAKELFDSEARSIMRGCLYNYSTYTYDKSLVWGCDRVMDYADTGEAIRIAFSWALLIFGSIGAVYVVMRIILKYYARRVDKVKQVNEAASIKLEPISDAAFAKYMPTEQEVEDACRSNKS